MTGEEMERAIQFLIEHHANVSAGIEGLKEAQQRSQEAQQRSQEAQQRSQEAQERSQEAQERAQETQARTAANLDTLTGIVADLSQSVSRLEVQAEANQEEMRDGFNKLILGNEVTRDLTQRVTRLAIETSQRVTAIEERLR